MIINLLPQLLTDPLRALLILILTVPSMLFATSLHETAHGFVAWRCGDNTARSLGRLTLNPVKHIDPIGLVFLLIFGYGWAKPVPINTRNFRNPKRGMALTALAGPAVNLLMGVLCSVFAGVFWGLYIFLFGTQGTAFWVTFTEILTVACLYGALINFVLMVFNMIPVPPFDGSRVALVFLPQKTYFAIMQYERQIMVGILVVLVILNYFNLSPFSYIANWLTNQIYPPVATGILNLLTKTLH